MENTEQNRAKTIRNFEPLAILGSGTFGYVIEAYDKENDEKVAVKRTSKAGDQVSREVKILTELEGVPYVAQTKDVFYSFTQKGQMVQNIVMEYYKSHSLTSFPRQLDNKYFRRHRLLWNAQGC